MRTLSWIYSPSLHGEEDCSMKNSLVPRVSSAQFFCPKGFITFPEKTANLICMENVSQCSFLPRQEAGYAFAALWHSAEHHLSPSLCLHRREHGEAINRCGAMRLHFNDMATSAEWNLKSCASVFSHGNNWVAYSPGACGSKKNFSVWWTRLLNGNLPCACLMNSWLIFLR